MVWDCVQIFAISLASAVTAEVLSWLLIYRTESYSSLQGKVEKLTKKLEKKKDGPQSIDKKKSRDKRIVQYEQQLQEANRDLTQSKMKSMFVIGITLVSLFGVINSSFGGLVVARLPFEPMPLVRSISHRGLLGVDYYECSAAFIYALCSMSLRTSVQKVRTSSPLLALRAAILTLRYAALCVCIFLFLKYHSCSGGLLPRARTACSALPAPTSGSVRER
ncbi:transmembrane and coiledcoil domains 1, putative [Acanthamoeba castellanii str. Neff]|uniref:Transmembrane and coiledcoil domains 1, putative n=1 Tax=Acanthamoeba castellanii (strain ATCC 30010 / Neff) TaxID=1257118 RepID=L8GNW7_ACACF|nr:transmembrane and coiledcoil domains 1, putative [Acanthamoeba castellanii str. Neff]ELR14814.1 transmembrane and coiledcoil domains 1, putative [Acanthamoeba castellanii str. Neff]